MMNYFIQINGLALVVLIYIYINLRLRLDSKSSSNILFAHMLYTNAILIFLNILLVVFNGHSDRISVILLPLLMIIFFIMNPILALMWFCYSDILIHNSSVQFNRHFVLYSIPVIINGIFAFLSLFGNYLFFIDANKEYHRGRFFYILLLTCYFYFFLAVVNIIRHRSNIRRGDLFLLLFFAIPALLASFLNALLPNVIILWSSVTFSLLIIFIFIQSRAILGDHLTGLFNKREFDNRFNDLSRRKVCKQFLGAVNMDLDNFKQINDLYGHDVGDQVLIDAGKLLMSSFKSGDFLARTGGDEFIATFDVSTEKEVAERIHLFYNNVKRFNAQRKYDFDIGFSVGIDIYDPKSGQTLASFFKELDNKMYLNKKAKRSCNYINDINSQVVDTTTNSNFNTNLNSAYGLNPSSDIDLA